VTKDLKNRVLLLTLIVAGVCVQLACRPQPAQAPQSAAAPAVVDPCALPKGPVTNNDETAWRLFVAVNCTSNGALTWETWTEQSCIANPASCLAPQAAATAGRPRRLHASQLAVRRKKGVSVSAAAASPGGVPCAPMTGSTGTGSQPPDPSLLPFVPANLNPPTAQFCEEVYADPTEAQYIQSNNLSTLTGQQAFSQTIAFPDTAVEVKVDWIPSTALKAGQTFTCGSSTEIYTETIGGACYALVAMHISSKLLPTWLWSTFEPQFTTTNPNRCNPALYSACRDSWGSSPAIGTGQNTDLSVSLKALMTLAGPRLKSQFQNYRLVGAQGFQGVPSDFLDTEKNPIPLGSSFVEFNAGVLPQQASCISCHATAMLVTSGSVPNTKPPSPENPNFSPFPAVLNVTPPYPGVPPVGGANPPVGPTAAQGGGTWKSQDFSWMLGIMPVK
jgi:hypothetical protein